MRISIDSISYRLDKLPACLPGHLYGQKHHPEVYSAEDLVVSLSNLHIERYGLRLATPSDFFFPKALSARQKSQSMFFYL